MSAGSRLTGSLWAAILGGTLIIGSSQAQSVPSSKQTESGLYVTAQDAAAMLQDPTVMLVDIRSRAEILALGLPQRANVNIPYMILPPMPEFNVDSGTYNLEINPDFSRDFRDWAEAHGLTQESTIVLMCRSGQRSARAANLLASMGYSQVYSMIDGYEGDRLAEGPNAGQRLVNGWRNAGLPWSYREAPEQVYPADL